MHVRLVALYLDTSYSEKKKKHLFGHVRSVNSSLLQHRSCDFLFTCNVGCT